jgi:hypothetical protein
VGASLIFFVAMQLLASKAIGVRLREILVTLRFSLPYVLVALGVVLGVDRLLGQFAQSLHVVVRFALVAALGLGSVGITARLLPQSMRGLTWQWLLEHGGNRVPKIVRRLIAWMAGRSSDVVSGN